jgi:hypothetical protein
MHEPQDEAQAIITRSVQAQALLDNEAFVWIVNDQTQYHLAALCATPPGPAGAADRETHYLQQHAFSELVAALQGYAAAGEAMQQALEAEHEDNQ